MYIKDLKIKEFGKFTGNLKELNLDSKINIIYGDNEAGKSTLYEVIRTLLYGFSPATADKHPYANWSKSRIEFGGTVSTGDKRDVLVERVLTSTPRGSIFENDKKASIKNDALPHCEHVVKSVYKGLYTLSVEDLFDINTSLWESVEDKLLSNYGIVGIKNPRDVYSDIDSKLDKIYRDSKRGKYKIKLIKDELKNLKKQRLDLINQEKEIRQIKIDRDNLKLRIKEQNNQLFEIKQDIQEIEELLPVKELMDEISAKETILKDYEYYRNAPENIEEKLEELIKLKSRYNSEILGFKDEIQRLDQKVTIINEQDKLIYDNSKSIRDIEKLCSNCTTKQDMLSGKEQELRRIKRAIHDDVYNIFDTPSIDGVFVKLKDINQHRLLSSVSKLKGYKDDYKRLKMEFEMSKGHSSIRPKLSIIYMGSLALGALSIIGLFLDNDFIKNAGLMFLVIGLFGVFNHASLRRHINFNKATNKELVKKQLDELRNNINRIYGGIIQDMNNAPIKKDVLENIDESIIKTIGSIKELYLDLDFVNEDISRIKEEQIKLKKDVEKLLGDMGIESSYDFISDIKSLLLRCDQINNGLKQNYSIELQKEDAQRRLERSNRDLQLVMEKLGAIDGYIDKSLKIPRVKDMDKITSMHRLMRSIEDNKLSMNNIVGIVSKKELISDSKQPINRSYINSLRRQSEESSSLISESDVSLAVLDERLSRYDGQELENVKSQIAILEDELQRTSEHYDKYAIISEFIKISHRKYKDENQPDIIVKASKYLNVMTEGKYTNLYLDSTDNDRKLLIKRSDIPMPISITSNLSKGTLNQIYLAIRLGILDKLEGDRERLPLIIDELFVNWDEARLDGTLRLIDDVAKYRQVIMFTCNPWMADKFSNAFNKDILKLA